MFVKRPLRKRYKVYRIEDVQNNFGRDMQTIVFGNPSLDFSNTIHGSAKKKMVQ